MDFELYMQDLLRQLSAGLLLPVLIILAGLALYALYCIGSIIAEIILQRRHFKENVPKFIASIEACKPADVQKIIKESGMLARQKKVLLVVADNMGMSAADLYALAKREIGILQEQYEAVTSRTDMAAKVAPMFGLMGTLIPLGPGIVAMGQGNTEVLASSLLVAFDTTVAGLICAAVCMLVSRLRKHWYRKYMSAVEASMTAILDKAEALRKQSADELIAEAEAILEEQKVPTPVLEPVVVEAAEIVEEAKVEEPAHDIVAANRHLPKEPSEPDWYQTAKMNANRTATNAQYFHQQPTEEFPVVSAVKETTVVEESVLAEEATEALAATEELEPVATDIDETQDLPSSEAYTEDVQEPMIEEPVSEEIVEEPAVRSNDGINLDDLLMALGESK